MFEVEKFVGKQDEYSSKEMANIQIKEVYSLHSMPMRRMSNDYKDTTREIEDLMEDIKSQIMPELNLLHNKLDSMESNIITCIRNNPAQNFKLLSKLGVLTFTMSLAIYAFTRIVIINPLLSCFGLLSCFSYLFILRNK